MPVTPDFQSSAGAAVVIGTRDETRLNHTIEQEDARETHDITTYMPLGFAKLFAYGLLGGMMSVSGFVAESAELLAEQLATVLGKNRNKPIIIIGPSGLGVGLEANFAQTLANSFKIKRSLVGVPSADVTFALTKTGILDGQSLHALHGAQSIGGNEQGQLVFTNTPSDQFLALRAAGAPETFGFRLSDFANDAALLAALKTGLEALPAYSERTVTITGALAGASAKTGTLALEWNGAVNVPALEALQGAFHVLQFNGATEAKTIYGTVSVAPGESAASVQAEVRAKGGEYAGALASVSGAGGNAVYTIAYPVGGNPGALITPKLGEKHVVSGFGNTFTIYGDVYDTATATLASVEAAIRAKLKRGSAVVTGTITPAVMPTSVNVSGAGSNDLNADYTELGQHNGATLYSRGGQASGYTVALLYDNNGKWIFADLETSTRSITSSVRYEAPGSASAVPSLGWVLSANSAAVAPAPTVTPGASVSVGSANLTIQYDASAGNVGDIETVPGAGYVGTNIQGETVADPQVSVSNSQNGIASSIAAITLLNGGLSDLSYNVVTASGADEWVDGGTSSTRGFAASVTAIDARGDGRSLTPIFEHADDNGQGVPNLGTISTIHQFEPLAQRAERFIAVPDVPVKRWRRLRYVVAGTNPQFVFAAALATL